LGWVGQRIAGKLDGANCPQLNGLAFGGILRACGQGGLDGCFEAVVLNPAFGDADEVQRRAAAADEGVAGDDKALLYSGLLRIQPAPSRDEPAEGAGDGGVGGELRIEEFAGHDGAGERHGAGPGKNADESEGGADGDG